MTRAVVVLALLRGFVASTRAQAPATPAPPVLTEAQAMQIRLLEMQTENAQLKVALAQAQLDAVAREGAAYLSSLQRDGFTLTRGERGWSYAPSTKAPTP